MSTEPDPGSDPSFEESIEEYDPTVWEDREDAWQCDNDVKRVRIRVSQGDTFYEIPTTRVVTEVTKGISSRDTFTRAHVPVEWQGERVVDIFDTWGQRSPGDNTFDVCTVDWYDEDTETWNTIQTGWLRGIGGTDTNGVVKIVISGFEQILSEISASKHFDEATYEDIFNYITTEIQNVGLSNVIDIQTATVEGGDVQFVTTNTPSEELDLGGEGAITTGGALLRSFDKPSDTFTKNFKSNEHNLVDILEFGTQISDTEWFFTSEGDLVVLNNPEEEHRTFVGERVAGGNLTDDSDFDFLTIGENEQVLELDNTITSINPDAEKFTTIENNALKEISPTNAVWVEGDTLSSVESWSRVAPTERPNATKTYPFAVAWYPALMANEPDVEDLLGDERNSPRAGIGQTYTTDHKTVDAAENAAKKRLKEDITTIGEGDMTISGKPFIMPDDKILAYPVQCDLVTIDDVFTYNVESVRHIQEGGDTYTTEVDCTVYVNEKQIQTASTVFEA